MKKTRVAIHDVTSENDIKYRGPLSYRHMRIIGWAAMICAQIAILCTVCIKYWADTEHNLNAINTTGNIFNLIGSLAVPLFLLANFALILSSRNDIKRLLIMHLGLSLLIYLIFIIAYERYLTGIFSKIFGESGKPLLDMLVSAFLSKFLSFNVFIDLLMCSLTYLFLITKPSKFFTGKKIYLFRCLVIIPIAYEVTCILLRGLSIGEGYFTLPVEVLPLLTTKSPFTFLAFLAIVIFLKFREQLYMKRTGGDEEKYQEFLQTNTNSLHFSIFIAVTFAIVATLDLVIYLVIFIANYSAYLDFFAGDVDAALNALNDYISTWGIGKATALFIAIPFVLLFSYTKKHSKKTKVLDMLIPASGLVLVLLTYIEGLFEIFVLK